MNIKYHNWLTLAVNHDYFPNSACNVIDFHPMPGTERSIKNYNLHVYKDKNTLVFYVGIDATKNLDLAEALSGLDALYFLVNYSDNKFRNYTDLPPFSEDQLFYFENGSKNLNPNALQQREAVSKEDLRTFRTPQFLVDIPSGDVAIKVVDTLQQTVYEENLQGNTEQQHTVALPPDSKGAFQLFINETLQEEFIISEVAVTPNSIGLLRLDISEVIKQSVPASYTLGFDVRSAFSQYKVVVPESRKIEVTEMEIMTEDGDAYSGPEEETLLGNQKAKVFTSPVANPLQQIRKKGPQLQVKYTNEVSSTEDEMEIALPNPDVANIAMYQIGEYAGAYFSSTIVYV